MGIFYILITSDLNFKLRVFNLRVRIVLLCFADFIHFTLRFFHIFVYINKLFEFNLI